MRRWIRRLSILAALALVIVALRLTVLRPAPVPVTVQSVERGTVEATVVNSRAGTVHSRHEAELSPGLSGIVTELPVKKGDRVARDDILLRINDEEYRAQVHLSERALEAARSTEREACLRMEQAQRDLRRHRSLVEQGFESDEVLEELQTKYDIAVSACEAARKRTSQADAALASARATLAKATLQAPFDGIVAEVECEIGEWVSPSLPGMYLPPVMDLIDPDHLYVRAPLDEVDVARIRPGLPVRITMDAFSGREFDATLSWTAPMVDTREEQNRTQEVEAVFVEGADLDGVLPGLSADVEIILESRTDVLRVPTYALLDQKRVLVVRGDHLEEVQVEVGLSNWEYSEITAGVSEGDRIVVSLDRMEVRAGARVTVEEERP